MAATALRRARPAVPVNCLACEAPAGWPLRGLARGLAGWSEGPGPQSARHRLARAASSRPVPGAHLRAWGTVRTTSLRRYRQRGTMVKAKGY
jgi:hypothetical protein